MIKAPYNFVPLSDKVFYPPWAEQVSHDIPFSDGESGEIEITITAMSPIFIRDHKNPEDFCQYTNKNGETSYYIPGTSVKGMVRNVLEIISFSKMSMLDNKTFIKNRQEEKYSHDIYHGVSDKHKSDEIDLSESIFGYVNDEKSLKGRVQFSHFKEVKDTCYSYKNTVKLILGTPKASYYPIYLEQGNSSLCITENHRTYDDAEFKISGWKRYPIHTSWTNILDICTDEDSVSTCFKPLKDGASFIGKIRYHNLKHIEIGAILSSLLFHNTENTHHNIGLAKAFGFGKIELKINNIISSSNRKDDKNLTLKNINTYLKMFEETMHKQVPKWSDSTQLTELITMATEHGIPVDSQLVYMSLHNGEYNYINNKNKNKIGGAYNFLCPFSKWDNVTSKKINTLLTSEEIERLNHNILQHEQELLEEEKSKKVEDRIKILESKKFQIPTNKKLKKAIESFVKFKIDLNPPRYYLADHLSKFLLNTLGDLEEGFDDIKKEYEKLNSIDPLILDLLKQREYGKATGEDLGVLFYLLNEELNA